jgi:COMPASS component SWD1
MPRPGRPARVHRLPQRLDYKLIPPPLDLNLPLLAEKAEFPAIIVTPSSPKTPRDYSIAFLCPPAKPTFRERVSSYFIPSALSEETAIVHDGEIRLSSISSSNRDSFNPKRRMNLKARTMLILLFLFFILVTHVITHRLATRLPHLDFNGPNHDSDMTSTTFFDMDSHASEDSGLSATLSGLWPSFQAFWGVVTNDVKREFIITEELS